jgi:hypothetical protein
MEYLIIDVLDKYNLLQHYPCKLHRTFKFYNFLLLGKAKVNTSRRLKTGSCQTHNTKQTA